MPKYDSITKSKNLFFAALIIAIVLSGCAPITPELTQPEPTTAEVVTTEEAAAETEPTTKSTTTEQAAVVNVPAPTASPVPTLVAMASSGSAPEAAESARDESALGRDDGESAALADTATDSAAPAIVESYAAEASSDRATGSAELALPAASAPVARSRQYEPVTAGVVDDNAAWDEYLDYRARHRNLDVNDRDVRERYIIRVWDESAQPVHDAIVTVEDQGRVLFEGRTDAGGQVFFHPRALGNEFGQQRQSSIGNELLVIAEKGWVAERAAFRRSGEDTWVLTLNNPPRAERTQLDLLFLVDDTGSMGDEIAKLTASMADIADEIATLPEAPDVQYGLVQYRDRGDSYVVRAQEFTPNLDDFQRSLSRLRGEGGGDYPEAVNAALHRAIWEMDWRSGEQDGDTVRVIILVADAPPHLDYGDEHFSYDSDMFVAVQQGIKIFPVGASGLDEQGEFIFRQLAQVTGGKFVFLTYEDGGDPGSGPGTETSHDVDNYSVDTLDRLIVRLVREELAKLSQPIAVSQVQPNQQQPTPTPTPVPPRCMGITWLLKETDGPFSLVGGHSNMDVYRGDTPCDGVYPVLCINMIDLSLPQSLARRVDEIHGWTGGEIRVTEPVSGLDLTSVRTADRMCSDAFDGGWRMAEFHDGGDGWNWWAYGEVPADARFWIWINTEAANPWD